ncbi:gas vesicle protein [Streptomyces adustus]|uniref:Gas vesicle protein n=1 Tax=Streptomyces adustus TaxID=1609272 RepID=A0A5N8VPL9_9ACTN|nr:gas vesicle protein [Streptomyces adustus]MPY36692.1 gas vesicle protein [Streptomyces adustus]
MSSYPSRAASPYSQGGSSTNLADILERVLDKGIVIAGDIRINLLDIELLTVKLRLIVASVDKAKEMGIDWWEHDPSLSSRAHGDSELSLEIKRLRAEIEALKEERQLSSGKDEQVAEEKPAVRRRSAPRSSKSRRSAEARDE